MTIRRGDTGVDRSTTEVDGSSHHSSVADDHSQQSTNITDASHTHTEHHANDNRRWSRRIWSWNWGPIQVSGSTIVSTIAVLAVAAVAALAITRVIPPPPSSSPAAPAAPVAAPAVSSGTSLMPPSGMLVVSDTAGPRLFIDATEITGGSFRAFLAAQPEWRRDRLPAPEHDGDYLGGASAPDPTTASPGRPVVFVTFGAADAYCRWQGRRLPTEDEWALAARLQPAGLADMAGSVWEWTSTADGGRYVVRGGGFQDPPSRVRPEARQALAPTATAPDLGFRCVADLPARQ